jgi:hypothetical protein
MNASGSTHYSLHFETVGFGSQFFGETTTKNYIDKTYGKKVMATMVNRSRKDHIRSNQQTKIYEAPDEATETLCFTQNLS